MALGLIADSRFVEWRQKLSLKHWPEAGGADLLAGAWGDKVFCLA